MSFEARLQASSKEYQKLQDDLQTAVDTQQRLDAQLNENEAVKKEFATLKPHNTVYKMIGPVLVKQEHEEARSNVDKRLEYIKGEISRIEDHISELSKKSEKTKTEIVTIQNVLQAQAQQAGEAAAAKS